MKDETLFTIIASTCLVLLFGGFGYGSYRMDKDRDETQARRVENCNKLNARYGKFYTTKDGPYAGQKMKAVKFGEITVTVQLDEEKLVFLCEDLKEY